MVRRLIRSTPGLGVLGTCLYALLLPSASAQAPKAPVPAMTPPAVVTIGQQDAQQTKGELAQLLEHYPPSLRGILALDPSLLNPSYLSSYPALINFLNTHPEIARNPSYYLGEGHVPRDRDTQVVEIWRSMIEGLAVFAGFGMGIGLLVWLIRTLIDYRRWNRLTKVQTDVHTRLLERFTANEDLIAYIQSPAGSNFLQSSPIRLDAAPRSLGAPLGRILWSLQGGVVLMAGGVGLQAVSTRVADDASQPLHALGVLGIALGLGFVVSAILSFLISRRLGLIEMNSPAPRSGTQDNQP